METANKNKSQNSINKSQNDQNNDEQEEEKHNKSDDSGDLTNEEVRDLIISTGLQKKSYEELIQERQERSESNQEEELKLESYERKWMIQHGKRHLIDFDDKERNDLKKYFKSLDADGSGDIGIEELQGPLISLGLADSKEDVKKIIDSVDDDHSGQIEFKEFLDIIKAKEKRKKGHQQQGPQQNNVQKNNAIIEFFKDMINGKLGGGTISKDLPFSLIISTIRRKKLLDAIMSNDERKKEEGQKVMKAYGKLMAIDKAKSLNLKHSNSNSGDNSKNN